METCVTKPLARNGLSQLSGVMSEYILFYDGNLGLLYNGLKLILEKQSVNVWTGFHWFRTGSNSRVL